MTKLTFDDVMHVAKLAKIDIDESEIQKYTSQLSTVIDYFSELNEVDTSQVEPTTQTTGLENVTRPDIVTEDHSLTQDEVLTGTENVYNGYFKVKGILEERSDK
jgi:aspartyl-tRNA(Asn)/glutamyl-tRNA(Gln) amidotransferase subunit C